MLAVLGVGQEIGLAHIKIEINRIKRHERREQCRRTRRRTTASNQIAHGNEMRAHAPCERRRNPAMVEVELRIANSGLCVFNRSPSCSLIRCALVYVLDCSSVALFQVFATIYFPTTQFPTAARDVESH